MTEERGARAEMTPSASDYDIAEGIVTTEGLTFALAVSVGKGNDLRTARGMLKEAIARALASRPK